ncbi:flagellar hook protein FlgE [Caldicoprobacter guelmensis]|uniref:flagellar hook protein FlgE n=1 Tax=Caldicoprobacter guelmensis TaxID=1170224 RepID=UPI00195CCEE9|nr:flagellar hook protein FlgE [Caldicoprobacter guelmensis]MBM7581385.1 flagellar hook protein FlgE [Caldicoprobacter guelmensis]
MMRSLYSGISGLRVHQVQMDVIGNNIANVNTVAFKSSRVTFQEILNQTLRIASAPSQVGGRGGTNPQQIGLGVSVGSIDVLHTSTGVQRTDRATDLAIDGEGFFMVSDGTNVYYTRAGNFDIDVLGNLVYPGGLRVLGWTTLVTDPITGAQYVDVTGTPGPINLSNLSMSAKATDMIKFEGNLDANVDVGEQVQYSFSVFDSLGNEHKLNYIFTKQAPNVWSWKIVPAPQAGAGVYAVEKSVGATAAKTPVSIDGANRPIMYGQDIKSLSVVTGSGVNQYQFTVVNDQDEFNDRTSALGSGQAVILVNGTQTVQVAFGDALPANSTVRIEYNDFAVSHVVPMVDVPSSQSGTAPGYDIDGDGIADIPAGQAHGVLIFGQDGRLLQSLINSDITIVMNPGVSGAADIFLRRENMQFDPSKFTQFAGATTVRATGNGYAAGILSSISIDSEGRVIGYYTNGQSREDAVLAIASFTNPGGLNKVGNNLYQQSTNSGYPVYGRAGIGGRGTIIAGALEMSNVDLAKEFTDMIVAQRGFQANSRIITVADEMLQELVNLKR